MEISIRNICRRHIPPLRWWGKRESNDNLILKIMPTSKQKLHRKHENAHKHTHTHSYKKNYSKPSHNKHYLYAIAVLLWNVFSFVWKCNF